MDPRNHLKAVRWKIDIDYADELSDEEKLWLSDFLDGHYSAYFKHLDDSKGWDKVKKRASEAARRAARREVQDCVELFAETEQTVEAVDIPRGDSDYEHTKVKKYKELVIEMRVAIDAKNHAEAKRLQKILRSLAGVAPEKGD